jgi:formiminotetrahydrofolate cyclodeaminase
MKLVDMTVNGFLKELGSSSPAPGGGSVSALAGANGCALVSMVGNLTVTKKKFKALEESQKKEFEESLKVFTNSKECFIDLVDKDTEAFNDLMLAYKLPKESEEEINNRNIEIEKSTIGCIKVPLKVALLGLECLRELPSIIKYGNRNTVSDQGVSALMLYSSIEGAAMNVLINLPGLSDENLKKEFTTTINDVILEAEELKDNLLEEIKYLLK